MVHSYDKVRVPLLIVSTMRKQTLYYIENP